MKTSIRIDPKCMERTYGNNAILFNKTTKIREVDIHFTFASFLKKIKNVEVSDNPFPGSTKINLRFRSDLGDGPGYTANIGNYEQIWVCYKIAKDFVLSESEGSDAICYIKVRK